MNEFLNKSVKLKEIIEKHNNEVGAVKEILEKGLAVSLSEARRYYYLVASSKRS